MKTYKQFMICRVGSNRPTSVRAVTEADMKYQFEVAPELTDRRILALVGSLISFEQRGDQEQRKRRNRK